MTQYRARTGCLTCRDRHIKCDESLPRCRNCFRSDRVCERGIRLNFIDIQTTTLNPPRNLPPGTQLVFRDESRNVASKYKVGSAAHNVVTTEAHDRPSTRSSDGACVGFSPANVDEYPEQLLLPLKAQESSSRLITNLDEALLMDVYVRKFTNLLPFYALSEPALYSGIMTCSARYLSINEPSIYYDGEACQNPQMAIRDPIQDKLLSAATELLLSASDAMSGDIEGFHMQHAWALMCDVGLNGRASGLAGACFWSHALMQLTHGLYHNVSPVWVLDSFDDVISGHREMVGSGEEALFGKENYWVRQMIYICTKVTILRAELTRNPSGYTAEQALADCEQYRGWCSEWANSVPRSMMPLCYIPAADEEPNTTSVPYVLLIGSAANVSRLLYHTSCLLLASMSSTESDLETLAKGVQRRHALDICAIASQAEEKVFCHVATCCLLIAAEALDHEDRKEALDIFNRITDGTPWAASKSHHIFD